MINLEFMINTLSLGSLYALLSLGLVLVYGILKLVNFAYGEYIMIGGYGLYFSATVLHLPWWVTVLFGILAAIVTSYLTELAAFRPVRDKSPNALIVTSFAVSIFLQNAVLILVSPRARAVKLPPIFSQTVNIAGVELTPQELRNAVYTGPWLTHAKSIFSKTNGPAYGLSSKYVTGSPIQQELLEKALKWKSGGKIEQYMADHQHDQNANKLWTYFQNVIWWVQQTFTTYRKEMKGIEWGPLYDRYKDVKLDTTELERRTVELLLDPDVKSHKGIYTYLLTGEEKDLSIRLFDEREKRTAYESQNHKCANGTRCRTPGNDNGQHVFEIGEMEGDHITPWSKGGKTIPENCQMLCIACNRDKRNL